MWFAVASTLNGAAGSAGSVSNRNLTACLGRAERSCATATPLLGRFICVGSIFSPRSSGYRPVRQCLVGKLPVPGVELVQDSLCARIEHEVQPPRWLYCRLRKNAMMWNPSSLSDRAMSQDGPQAMTRIKFLSSCRHLGCIRIGLDFGLGGGVRAQGTVGRLDARSRVRRAGMDERRREGRESRWFTCESTLVPMGLTASPRRLMAASSFR